ncbi:MAG: efflux RND transporter periplasmic adaptor subunit [Colwellia sp.]
MKKLTKFFIIGSCLISSLNLPAIANGFPPANVNVVKITKHELAPSIWVSGTVASKNNSKIASEVSGRLISIAEIGSIVKKGEVIAKIDDSHLKINLLEEQANVLQSEADLRYLEAELKRTASLVDKNLSATITLEKNTTDRDIAKGRLMVAKARLAQTENDLAFSQLKAPFSGIVAQRIANLGEYVNSGNAIIRLVELANKEAIVYAPITSYQFIHKKNSLMITSAMGEGEAPIKSFVPVANDLSHLMEVRLDMSHINWPFGLNIKVQVASGKSVETIGIPRDALVLRREGLSVFRVNEQNQAEKISVEVALASGNFVSVKNTSTPLQVGDNIVIRGAERLQDGQVVAIKENNDQLVSGTEQATLKSNQPIKSLTKEEE